MNYSLVLPLITASPQFENSIPKYKEVISIITWKIIVGRVTGNTMSFSWSGEEAFASPSISSARALPPTLVVFSLACD